MTECKQCNTIIPDGMEYCEKCKNEHRNKADESYLDSLLNSVIPMGGEAPRRNRKQEQMTEQISKDDALNFSGDIDPNQESNLLDIMSASDVSEFEMSNEEAIVDALVNLEDEYVMSDKPADEFEYDLDTLDDETNAETELEALDDSVYDEEDDFAIDENRPPTSILENLDMNLWKEADAELKEMLESLEESNSDESVNMGKPDFMSEESLSEDYNIFDEFDEDEFDKLISEELSQPVIIEDFEDELEYEKEFDDVKLDQDETVDFPSEESILFEENDTLEENNSFEDNSFEDNSIEDNSLENISESVESEDEMLAAIESAFLEEEIVNGKIEEEDFLSIPDTFVLPEETEDEIEVEELLPTDMETEQDDDFGQEDQVALTESFEEDQSEMSEDPFDNIMNMLDEISEVDQGEEQAEEIPEVASVEVPEKKKKNLFQRIFGNVIQDRTEEEKEQYRLNVIAEANEKVNAEELKKNKTLEDKEAEKKEKEQKAAEKKAADAAKKVEKAEAAKLKKLENEEQKRQKKEAMLAVIDGTEDEGRINRVGASILVVVFIVLTLFVIVGTNMYFYKISIQNANTNFEWQRYNEAYNDVYGLDLKPEDFEIYEKIVTVMYVNKQLNSYNNYYSIGYYSEALDSLLKGLQRYDKYIEFAKRIGIESDMDYVRSQITEELETTFSVSEAVALNMIALSDKENYSKIILEITQGLTN